jgi:hypothetical protein
VSFILLNLLSPLLNDLNVFLGILFKLLSLEINVLCLTYLCKIQTQLVSKGNLPVLISLDKFFLHILIDFSFFMAYELKVSKSFCHLTIFYFQFLPSSFVSP